MFNGLLDSYLLFTFPVLAASAGAITLLVHQSLSVMKMNAYKEHKYLLIKDVTRTPKILAASKMSTERRGSFQLQYNCTLL